MSSDLTSAIGAMFAGRRTVASRYLACLLGLTCLSGAPWAPPLYRDVTQLGQTQAVERPVRRARPLTFEPSWSRATGGTGYSTTGDGFTAEILPTGVAFSFETAGAHGSSGSTQLWFDGASSATTIEGGERQQAVVHRYAGRSPSEWRFNIPTYGRVRAAGLYRGIDALYYSSPDGNLEYDFVVAPGADASQIAMRFADTDQVDITAAGDLEVTGAFGRLVHRRPRAYQMSLAGPAEVRATYIWRTPATIGFALDGVDPGRPLVIDPIVSLASYVGGAADDESLGIGVDAAGDVYIAGVTRSSTFASGVSVRSGGLGNGDAFVTRLDGVTGAVIFTAYLGGAARDVARAVTLGPGGDVFLTGETGSTDFPVTPGSLQPLPGGGTSDAFVARLSAAGALKYATYVGGSDREVGRALAIGADHRIYVVGRTASPDFPLRHPVQAAHGGPPYDAFVTRYSADGLQIEYSSILGGSGDDGAYGIVVDASGVATVAGYGSSPNVPTTRPLQAANAGGYDVLVWKFSGDGRSLQYATYLGGAENDYALGLVADAAGNIHLAGATASRTFAGVRALQAFGGGDLDAFISSLDPAGSTLRYWTPIGGQGADTAFGIAIDPLGHLHIAGRTASPNFPLVEPTQGVHGGGEDAFVTRLDPQAMRVLFSTFVGGSGLDSSGALDVSSGGGVAVASLGTVWLTGFTSSTDLPLVQPSQAQNAGLFDAFVARITSVEVSGASPSSGPTTGGTRVRIDGVNFAAGASVLFGGVPAGVVALSTTTLDVLTGPVSSPGLVDVTVRNPDGGTATLAAAFRFRLPSTPRLHIDVPGSAAVVTSPFVVAGWALDEQAQSGTAIDDVHVYALPASGAPAVLLGIAERGLARPDVAAAFGARFLPSGFAVRAAGLRPGAYTIVCYGRSVHTGTFSAVRAVEVVVGSGARLQIDAPAPGPVSSTFRVSGWVLDGAAATGTGVDAVHVWAHPHDGSAPTFAGAASYGLSRPDVGGALGSQFMASGYDLPITTLPAGRYTLVVYARSTISWAFDIVRTVEVTVAPPPPPLMAVDLPVPGLEQPSTFRVAGWALDSEALSGSGIGAVHVWAYPHVAGQGPMFVGAATIDVARPDVAAAFGSQFGLAGFNLETSALAPGTYTLIVYAWSLRTTTWAAERSVTVVVR